MPHRRLIGVRGGAVAIVEAHQSTGARDQDLHIVSGIIHRMSLLIHCLDRHKSKILAISAEQRFLTGQAQPGSFSRRVPHVLRDHPMTGVIGNSAQLARNKDSVPHWQRGCGIALVNKLGAQQEVVHIQGDRVCVCHHRDVDLLAHVPVPGDTDMHHGCLCPGALEAVVRLLGEPDGIGHAKVGIACVV